MSYNDIGLLLRETGKPAEALRAFEAARAIRQRLADANPTVTQFQRGLALSHDSIGLLLRATGKPAEALRSYESARAIQQRLADANPTVTKFQNELALSQNNIGNLLRATGKPAEALRAYEAARAIWQKLVQDHPESPDYASRLGGTLNNLANLDLDARRFAQARDRLRPAIAWQKKALTANPKHPTYRQFLADHLGHLVRAARGLGRDDEAAAAQRELDELKATDPRFAALDARLAIVLKGELPRDNAERLSLAQRAYDTRLHAAAARLWAEALAADPKLAADRQAQHRYNAACAAALAAAGEGKDDPPPDALSRARLRREALDWLKAERDVWARLLAAGPPPQVRAAVVQTLQHWKVDTDLVSVRDAESLAKLPEAVCREWRALWDSVDDLMHGRQPASARPLTAPTSELPEDPFTRP
jgi:tetratricopeptide (TPR) repeat protein